MKDADLGMTRERFGGLTGTEPSVLDDLGAGGPTQGGEGCDLPSRSGAKRLSDVGCRLMPVGAVGDDGVVRDEGTAAPRFEVPRIPASAGALIFDHSGRVLVLKPNYKKGWTIPGGQIDPGESPWEACQRETREECGLEITSGRLVCVDFLRPKSNRPGGVRFLFDCGAFTEQQLTAIRLQDAEIEEHRLAELSEATTLLSGPLRRRVSAGVGAERCVYLENGRPVAGLEA